MVPGYIALVVLIAARVDRSSLARRRESPRCRRRLVFLARGGDRCPSHGVVLSRDRRWVPAPTKRWAAPFRLYEPTARLRGHQVVARAVAEKVKAAGGTRRVAVRLDGDLRPDVDALFLPSGPARDLLPELELRHDAGAGEPARPVAPEPAPRPGSIQESARRRRGRLQHAAQLCLAHEPERCLPQARFDRTPGRARARRDHRFLGYRDLPGLPRTGRLQAEPARASEAVDSPRCGAAPEHRAAVPDVEPCDRRNRRACDCA